MRLCEAVLDFSGDDAEPTVVCEPVVLLVDFKITGLSEDSGHVYSVCVEIDWVDVTAAAKDFSFWMVEASHICLASVNDIFFSNLRRVISRCRFHSGQSLG